MNSIRTKFNLIYELFTGSQRVYPSCSFFYSLIQYYPSCPEVTAVTSLLSFPFVNSMVIQFSGSQIGYLPFIFNFVNTLLLNLLIYFFSRFLLILFHWNYKKKRLFVKPKRFTDLNCGINCLFLEDYFCVWEFLFSVCHFRCSSPHFILLVPDDGFILTRLEGTLYDIQFDLKLTIKKYFACLESAAVQRASKIML